MVRKKSPLPDRQLTEVELELMNLIWDLGECTVRDVMDRLPKDRELAYTSVATVVKILEQKGFLASRKGDKAHTYLARVSREVYEASSLKHMTESLFRGDPTSMVSRLINDADLSSEELVSLRKLINERLGKT